MVELRGKGAGSHAIVDQSDEPLVLAHKWHLSPQGYAVTRIDGKKVLLHRFLMGANGSLEVDHINRNPLDNRRANLRWVTRSQNIANSPARTNARSGCKGVRCHKGVTGTYWRAQIRVNGRVRHLGSFPTQEQASAAFTAAHDELYGGAM